jgi:hypothetical protein
MFEAEQIIPLTLGELNQLTDAIPLNKRENATEIMIVANEDRVCLKDLKNQQTISWIKRQQKILATG